MINLWKKFKKKQKIKKILKSMPAQLHKNYHKQNDFTVAQVRWTYNQMSLDPLLICYAYAAFLPNPLFDRIHKEMNEHCDYKSMRQEMDSIYPLEKLEASLEALDDSPSWSNDDFSSAIDFDAGGDSD